MSIESFLGKLSIFGQDFRVDTACTQIFHALVGIYNNTLVTDSQNTQTRLTVNTISYHNMLI
jgi:hypothetical protein